MKHKPSFLNQNSPLITCMIIEDNVNEVNRVARNAMFAGCDAYGIQIEHLRAEDRTDEKLRGMFSAMSAKPIYITNYRECSNKGKDDGQLVDELVHMVSLGATLCDVMGDYYAPDPLQMTFDAAAISKQMDGIKRIHDAGGEVLMSSHTFKFMSGDEVLRFALEAQKRGADISKIVTMANSEAEEYENLRTIERLKNELEIPFLFLCGGSHNKIVRQVGPFLGVCMWLVVEEHDAYSAKVQPLCRSIRAIADNFDRY